MRTVFYTDGSTLNITKTSMPMLHKLIGADTIDTVNLRNGDVMLVDDAGHAKGLPVNQEATKFYHSVCKPGTTHVIRGNVVVVPDLDFA